MFGFGKLTRDKLANGNVQKEYNGKDLTGLDLSGITFTQCELRKTRTSRT